MIKTVFAFFFFSFPLFFLSTTADFYEYNKLALAVLLTLILAILFSFEIVKHKRLTLISSTYSLSLFLITSIIIVSTLLVSPNIVVASTTPLSTTTWAMGLVLYLLLIHLVEEKEKQTFLYLLIFSSILLSFYSIAQLANILPQGQYTPAGSLASTIIFLSIVAFFLMTRILIYFTTYKGQKQQPSEKTSLLTFFFLSLSVIGGTCLILSVHLIASEKTIILPYPFGWNIMLETFKGVKTLLLGVGPSNFITAFTLAKPLAINNTLNWNIIFTSSSSFLMNLATESGVLAAFLYMVIFFQSIKLLISYTKLSHISQLAYVLTLIFALLLQSVFLSSMSIFLLTIILLSFSAQRRIGPIFEFKSKRKPVCFIVFPTIILTLLIFYLAGRAYFGEVLFKKSLDSFLSNKGADAYNYQNQAILANPYLDRYHNAFARTSFLLANSLASKEELTEEDKQNIPRLVQQSIDEARRAVVLYWTNIFNWDNLGRTYASLINFAQGAETWAEKSYNQRIVLDPVNPNARIILGGLYLTLERFEEAEQRFRQAVDLKPDLANAHYNLSIALKKQKKFDQAFLEMQTALAYLLPDSEDANRVKNELDDLRELVPETVATSSAPIDAVVTEEQKLERLESSPSALENLQLPEADFSLPEPPISPY